MKNKIIILLSLIGISIFIYNYYMQQQKIIKGNQALNYIISSCEENIKRDIFFDKNNTYFMYYSDTFAKIIQKKQFQEIGKTFKKAKFHEKLSRDAYLKSYDFFIKIKGYREEKNRPNKEILLDVGFDLFKRAIYHKDKKYELLNHGNILINNFLSINSHMNLSLLKNKLLELDDNSECIDKQYFEKENSLMEKYSKVENILDSLSIELLLLDDYEGSKKVNDEFRQINNGKIILSSLTKYNLSCYYSNLFKIRKIRKLEELKKYDYISYFNPEDSSMEEKFQRLGKLLAHGILSNLSLEDILNYQNKIKVLLE